MDKLAKTIIILYLGLCDIASYIMIIMMYIIAAGAVVPVSHSVLTSPSIIKTPSRSEYFQLESEIKKLVKRFENIVEAFEESLIEIP